MNSTVREELYKGLNDLLENQFEEFKWRLMYIDHSGKPNIYKASLEKANKQEVVDLLIQNYGEDAPKVCICVLQKSNINDVAEKLEKTLQQVADIDIHKPPDSSDYRNHIKKKFQIIEDPNAVPGEYVLLNQRYSKLILVDYYQPIKEREHEILATGRKHVEIISKRAESSASIETLFNRNKYGLIPQTVVLQGAAGIGKTTMAKKIMLDWASQQLYHDKFNYVFYIYCREMNLHAESEKSSIAEIISRQWPRCHGVKNILENEEKLLFIIDGFDELRYSFDHPKDSFCFDPWKEEPVKIILRSLFRKKLLPESSLIITTRPIALEKLHRCLEHPQYFQILGFSTQERKEYFSNFFENKDQATQAFRFVKQNDTLFTMCVIPLVCWIACTMMKQEMERGVDLQKTPCTLTAIYMLYLSSLLTFHHNESKQDVQRKLKSFCSLAAEGMRKHQILFMEEEVKKHSLDQDDLFPLFLNQNIFRRDIHCVQTFSFIHLSFQEFFASLFYVLEGGEEQHSENLSTNLPTLLHKHRTYFTSDVTVVFYFLFGFLNEENRMKELKKEFGLEISYQNKELLLDWMKNSINARDCRIQTGSITGTNLYWVSEIYSDIYICYFLHKEISFNFQKENFNYLYETQDENFVKDALCAITTIAYNCQSNMELVKLTFCLQHWQNLESFCFQCHESIMDSYLHDMRKWSSNKRYMDDFFKALAKMRKLRVLRVENVPFIQSYSRQLAEVLKTNQNLKDLSLFLEHPSDRAMELLCEGLQHPDCKVEIFELYVEAMTKFCSSHLAKVFRRNQRLRELKLWLFNPKNGVVKKLCEGLQHPDCRVENLCLNENFTTESCSGHVAEVLKRNQRIRELKLWHFKLANDAFKMLCKGLQHPDCKVETL